MSTGFLIFMAILLVIILSQRSQVEKVISGLGYFASESAMTLQGRGVQ